MSRLTIVKNAFANLCRGGAAAVVVLLLPPFLTRILDKDAYDTWLLILQLSTYVSFLDFGIQTAVGRFVAHHNQLGEFRERDGIVSTAVAILSVSALFASAGVSILAWQIPHLFKDMPPGLHQDAQLSLLCVGISLAIALPFSVFGGIFVGLQRYDIPAWIIGVSKLLVGIFVVLVANASHSIVMMALVMAVVNIGAGIWQFLAYKKFGGDIQVSINLISRSRAREVFSYCFSLTIWSLAMLLVSGLDTIIIGYFDYKSVSAYVLANSVILLIAGIQNSLFSVLMPNAASLSAKGDSIALGKMLVTSTRYNLLIALLISTPIMLFGGFIISFWVGEQYQNSTFLFLKVLLIANIVRLSTYPYIIILIGTDQQRKVIITPIIEGFSNFISSVLLASVFGGIGVAWGTVIGGFVGVSSHILYNMKNTTKIQINLYTYLVEGIIVPIIWFSPIMCYSLLCSSKLNMFSLMVNTIIICLTLLSAFKFILLPRERKKFFSMLSKS